MTNDNDRERILVNIAALLAQQLSALQLLPEVRRHMASGHSLCFVRCISDFSNRESYNKGDLVACHTSVALQQNPYIISFVEGVGTPNDANGLLLKAIGRYDTCNYGNESFIKITGIPPRLLWAGEQRAFEVKLNKVLRKLDTYIHRFRGIDFVGDGEADVWFGEIFGGMDKRSKPYSIRVKFTKKITMKNIREQLIAGGFGTRKFEEDDGAGEAPFGNPKTIKREDVIGVLKEFGAELRP